MNTFKKLLSAAVLAACFSTAAQASIYHFDFNGTNGMTPGVVAGDINLGFSNGTGAATSITLTSFPGSFGALPEGNVATSWAGQVANSFTLVGGVITTYDFMAITGPAYSGTELCLNNSANSNNGFGRGCPSGLSYLGDGSVHTSAWVFSGINVSSVPVPAAAWLLGSGLLGLVGVARKSKAA